MECPHNKTINCENDFQNDSGQKFKKKKKACKDSEERCSESLALTKLFAALGLQWGTGEDLKGKQQKSCCKL